MIFLDSVFLFVFLKCLPVMVFVITITFATFVEWFSCLKSYWSVVAFIPECRNTFPVRAGVAKFRQV